MSQRERGWHNSKLYFGQIRSNSRTEKIATFSAAGDSLVSETCSKGPASCASSTPDYASRHVGGESQSNRWPGSGCAEMASRNRIRSPLACGYDADRFDEDSHHINLLNDVIYDLAANPEYLSPLLKSSIRIIHRRYLLLDHIRQFKLLFSLIKASKSTIGSAGPECLAPCLYIALYHSRPRPVFYHCN